MQMRSLAKHFKEMVDLCNLKQGRVDLGQEECIKLSIGLRIRSLIVAGIVADVYLNQLKVCILIRGAQVELESQMTRILPANSSLQVIRKGVT